MSCGECGEPIVWHDDVGSAVCTACGTLVNSSCSVLTSHLDTADNSDRQYNNHLWNTTLKSIRRNDRWDLAGQGKEARDRKNNYAIHEFIRSISSNLSDPGISSRAITLFSQAMAAGRYRWGRKAKLIAAASIAIARRESNRSDSLRVIASLIDEPLLALSRTFTTVITVLCLSLTAADPALHLPSLHSCLSTLINPQTSPNLLPAGLGNALVQLPLPSVLRTANALSQLLTSLGDTHTLAALPTPATACAILILALEAEARSSLPNIGKLAQHLASHIGTSEGVVMARYRLIYEVMEEWIKELPWLDQFETKNGRSKIARRVVVARGLKDVIQFREEIRTKKLDALEHPVVTLDVAGDMRDDGSDDDKPPPKPVNASVRPRKRRKIHHALDDARQFLLNPLSAPLPPFTGTSSDRNSSSTSPVDWTTYLLTASPSALSLGVLPTRLQRLAVERGEKAINDDELFEDGEWETMMRTEDEREALRNAMDWGSTEEESEDKVHGKSKPEQTKTGGSKRINMEVLSKLLQDRETLGEKELDWLRDIDGIPDQQD